ncbi:MAG: HNH endonuclease [Clostridium sp.]
MCRNYTAEQLQVIEKIKNEQTRCFYCGKELKIKQRTIDHIIPLNRGGKTEYNNLIVCCKQCNIEKGDMTIKEYRKYLTKKEEFLKAINSQIEIQEKMLSIYKIESLRQRTKHIIKLFKRQRSQLAKIYQISITSNCLGNLDIMEDIFNQRLDIDVNNILNVGLNNVIGGEEQC